MCSFNRLLPGIPAPSWRFWLVDMRSAVWIRYDAMNPQVGLTTLFLSERPGDPGVLRFHVLKYHQKLQPSPKVQRWPPQEWRLIRRAYRLSHLTRVVIERGNWTSLVSADATWEVLPPWGPSSLRVLEEISMDWYGKQSAMISLRRKIINFSNFSLFFWGVVGQNFRHTLIPPQSQRWLKALQDTPEKIWLVKSKFPANFH